MLKAIVLSNIIQCTYHGIACIICIAQELDCGELSPWKVTLPLKLILLDKLDRFTVIPLQTKLMLGIGLHQMVEILPMISWTSSVFNCIVERDITVTQLLVFLPTTSSLQAIMVRTHVRHQTIMEIFKKLLSGCFKSTTFQVCVHDESVI